MDSALLNELLKALLSAQQVGPVAATGGVVLLSLRAFKTFAPNKWDALPQWAKLGLPFATAFVGTLLTGLTAGVVPALGLALTAGLSAVGLHHGTKAVGAKVAPSLVVPSTPLRSKALKLLLDTPRPTAKVLPLRK